MADTLDTVLHHPRYPRSGGYDAAWVLENLMGPNVLWLTEALTHVLDLQPGMRVLDLGPGRCLSSVFLAREFGVQVWAADLWVDPSSNLQRIRAAGCDEHVFPLRAEAHTLPFADGFFDAIVSMDAFHYFGSSDLYPAYLMRFLRPGGQVGIVVPGLAAEMETLAPHLAPYWEPDYWSFHSADWWARHWRRSGLIDVTTADFLPEGWKDWLRWDEACEALGYRSEPKVAEMLRVDAGRTLGFARVAGRRRHEAVVLS